jgi:hypothetical protein
VPHALFGPWSTEYGPATDQGMRMVPRQKVDGGAREEQQRADRPSAPA